MSEQFAAIYESRVYFPAIGGSRISSDRCQRGNWIGGESRVSGHKSPQTDTAACPVAVDIESVQTVACLKQIENGILCNLHNVRVNCVTSGGVPVGGGSPVLLPAPNGRVTRGFMPTNLYRLLKLYTSRVV